MKQVLRANKAFSFPWLANTRYLASEYSFLPSAAGLLAKDTIFTCPFWCARRALATAINCYVNSIHAGQARMGIYDTNASFYPTVLILDAGTIDTGTTGLKSINISLWIPARKFLWLAFTQSAAGSMLNQSITGVAAAYPIGSQPSAPWSSTHYRDSTPYAPLPNPFNPGKATSILTHPLLTLTLAPGG